jgi:hypothetical protein
MKNENNANISDLLNKRIAGIKKYLTKASTEIWMNGKECHPADILEFFQTDLDARAAVDAAHAAVKTAITARKTADANRRSADDALKAWFTNRFGVHSAEAQELGYSPPKPKTKDVKTKAAAIQKSAATRAARHTMGKVQKLDISGTKLVYSSQEAAAAAAKASVAPVASAPPSTNTNTDTQPEASQAATPTIAPAAPATSTTNGAAHA